MQFSRHLHNNSRTYLVGGTSPDVDAESNQEVSCGTFEGTKGNMKH